MLNREGENRTQLLQTILDTSPNCIYVKDNQGRYLIANKTIADLYQTTPEEMIGKKDEDFASQAILKPNEAEFFQDIDKKAIETKETQVIPSESFTYDDGTLHYFFTTKTPIIYQDDPDCVLGISVDITKLKEKEIQALENEQKFKSLFNNSPDIIALTDLHGTILDINRVDEGFNKLEVIGANFKDFLSDEDTKAFQKTVEQAIQTRKPSGYQCKISNPLGKTVYWYNRISPQIIDGKPSNLIINCTDITESKETEQKLKRIFAMSSELICEADINTATFTKINPVFTKVLGYMEEELLSQPFINFIHPDDKEPTQNVIDEQLQRGEKVLSFINRYRCKDGSYVWLDWNSFPIPEEGIIYAFARNITEKKKWEESLKESEEKYRLLAEQGTEVIFTVDLESGQYEYMSPSCEKVFGVKPEEFYDDGALILRIVPKDAIPYIKEVRNKVVEGTIDPVFDFPIIHQQTKEKRWLRHHSTLIKDDAGKPLKLRASVYDITSEKKIKDELKQREGKYRQIFDMSPVGICTADKNGKIIDINQSGAEITGHSREELIGKSYKELHFIDKKMMLKLLKDFPRLIRGKPIGPVEMDVIDNEGKTHVLEVEISPVHGNDRFNGSQITMHDVTERNTALKALHQSEKKYRSYIENAPNGVFICDEKGNYLEVNDEAVKTTGYSEDELLNMNIADMLPENEKEQGFHHFQTLLQKGKSVGQAPFIHKDGTVRWWQVNAVKLSENRFLAFTQDVTEKKKAEEALIESERKYHRLYKAQVNGFAIFKSVFNDQGEFISYEFIDINPAYERITGVKREEVIGKDIQEVFPGTEQSWIDAYGSVAVTGESKTFEMYHEPTKKHYFCNVFRPWDDNQRFCVAFNDITEIKKAENEIKESEKKYRTLFDTMAQGVVYQDANGEIISANPAAERILGLTLTQMQGRTSMHPDWKTVDKDKNMLPGDKHPAMIALKTGEEVCDFLQGVFNPERNEYVWIIVNSIPQFKPGNDKPYQVYSTFLDVTKRIQNESEIKKQNKELNQSKNETEMILNTAGDGIRIVTKDLKIKTVNDTFAEMVGLSKDEVIGRNCSDVFKSDVCGTDNCPLRKVLQTGEGFEEETSRKTLDDREIQCILKVTPYRDEHGEIIGIIEDFRDITTLKKAQARFRIIFENKGTATGTFGDDNIITQCNSKFVEQSGYTKDEIIGKMHWYDFVHKDDIEEMMQFHKQRSAGGNPPGLYECRMVTKNGDIRTMIVNIGVIPDSKERVVSLVDITKQKNAEQKLEDLNRDLEKEVKDRTQQIQKLLIQKDEFINQLGHDIKNPLGPLVNLLPLLEKNENDPKKKDMIQVMNRNVRYIKNLVSRTIQLAQLKSPSTGLHYEHVNLSDEIKDVIDTNRLLFEENHITVQNNISDDLRVDADRLKIHEVFNNLLNNAVKYNKEDGGDIIINQTFNDDDTLTISICDTGVGMTGEQLEKVFDEFYKADSSRHDFDSSGLGMSITKRIIELHGGKIWAESKGLGKGSTFYFTLPKSDSKS